ncbi:MAG: class I SAM-dependent methyltransferase [Pseudomonadota bacterium]|nr:class I SAM-dependent methyltransferase [Pseudomonadota bacterium]
MLAPLTHQKAKQIAGTLFPAFTAIEHWRPWICPFEELINRIPPQARLLDAGCGSGLFLGMLAHTGRIEAGLGFDQNGRAVERAQAMAKTNGLSDRLSFQAVDAADPWPDFKANVVTLIDVMHHIPRAVRPTVFKQAADRLPIGGRLIYKDMASASPVWASANRFHDLVMARQWIWYVNPKDVQAWATETHLTLIANGRKRLLAYDHEWLVFEKQEAPCPDL